MKEITYDLLTSEVLSRLQPYVLDVRKCILLHPSTATWARWLREVGFTAVMVTYPGGWFAGQLLDRLPATRRGGTSLVWTRLYFPSLV